MSDERATFCHVCRYELATFCDRQLNFISVTEKDGATHIILLTLVGISKDPEDLRRSFDRDDRLEDVDQNRKPENT